MSRKPPILIVDDEPDMCWAMEHILHGHGHRVVTVQNGGDALAALERESFRLVFMDAKLPDIDGLEVARRAHQRRPHERIILVSGYYYADDPVIRRAMEQQMISAFIAKPFTQQDILRALAAG